MSGRPVPGSGHKHKSADKQVATLVRQLRKRGLTVEISGSGHWKITREDGSYMLSFSNSSTNATHQVRAVKRDLRKYHGINLA